MESLGWSEDQVRLAQTHIISRAVFPASELETTRWIRGNSAVCEVTGYNIEQVTKDRLYAITKKLYAQKEALEQHLSVRTNELFDIEDKIILYDLTNTYFEGRKQGSNLAKFGRSKMIGKLRIKTSSSARKALVVIDAGIATDENLEMILDNGYDYLCVSRSSLKIYNIEVGATTVSVTDNRKQKIELCQVNSDRNTDYYLKVESQSKELKERSMNEQFRARL